MKYLFGFRRRRRRRRGVKCGENATMYSQNTRMFTLSLTCILISLITTYGVVMWYNVREEKADLKAMPALVILFELVISVDIS